MINVDVFSWFMFSFFRIFVNRAMEETRRREKEREAKNDTRTDLILVNLSLNDFYWRSLCFFFFSFFFAGLGSVCVFIRCCSCLFSYSSVNEKSFIPILARLRLSQAFYKFIIWRFLFIFFAKFVLKTESIFSLRPHWLHDEMGFYYIQTYVCVSLFSSLHKFKAKRTNRGETNNEMIIIVLSDNTIIVREFKCVQMVFYC